MVGTAGLITRRKGGAHPALEASESGQLARPLEKLRGGGASIVKAAKPLRNVTTGSRAVHAIALAVDSDCLAGGSDASLHKS